MVHFHEKLKVFFNNRWLVFVCAVWVQSSSGAGYLFGSISPVIKSTMGYNQKQLAILGVVKDLGACLGFVAGSLSEVLPSWGLLLSGAVQNFIGYGLLWLIVTQRLPTLPLWVLCICIYVGANGETFFNTADLISCVQNFPKHRGPVVGILKGFAGLSGAILTQVYVMINAPNKASLIFMVAVGPSMVVIALMFIVRPVEGHKQVRASDGSSFLFTYGVCLILAAYLLGVLILEHLLNLNQTVVNLLAMGLLFLVLLPIIIPIILVSFSSPKPSAEESLLAEPQKQEAGISEQETNEVILSEVEDEKSPEVDMLPASERHKRMTQLQAKLFQAAADGAVRVRRRKGPRRGENFTLTQALVKADFLLLFISLVLAAGSGLTIFNNLGQITQSIGYTDSTIFVAMISIWNFLGRVGGGYFSEIITRDFSYPRPVAMAIVQVIMALGFLYYAMGWSGQIYVVSLLVGLGYGAHWAIIPASVSELFGLRSFGALYNFITLANPAGSLIFSELIASGIYDYYAEKQAALRHQYLISPITKPFQDNESLTCLGSICYSLTCGILSGVCIVATVLSMIVVYRTRRVYSQLYGNPLS
ncbi:Major facilitator [Parasponia andersonii]|uniref:Major facilitator n=1 Tax=Parasponia andersonii TaxID=3476 RepID=A0A2P5DVF8_PARAD|nr:Major facilitator [Parasponia andersonii]